MDGLELADGLLVALATPLGRFARFDPALQDRDAAVWARAIDPSTVVLGRVHAQPAARELVATLAAIPGPANAAETDALAYARAVAAALPGTCAASLAILRRTERGVAGWIAGAVQVFRLEAPLGLASPPQTVLVPAARPELAPDELVRSGVIAGAIHGGDAFAVAGARFAVVLGAPLELDEPTLAELGVLGLSDALATLGMHASAQRSQTPVLVGVWDAGSVFDEPAIGDRASRARVPRLGLATSWADLLDPVRGRAGQEIELALLAEDTLGPEAGDDAIARAYCDFGERAAATLALAGPRVAAHLLDEPRCGRVVAGARSFGTPRAGLGPEELVRIDDAIGCALVSAAIGRPLEAVPDAVGWIAVRSAARPEDVRDRVWLALAALAHGRGDLAEPLVGPAAPPEEGERFGFDRLSFVRALASGVAGRADPSALAAAYDDWLRAFPHLLAAESIGWIELVHAAVAFHARTAGRAIAEVGALLHDELRALADARAPTGAGGPRDVRVEAGGQRGHLGFARLGVRFAPRPDEGVLVATRLDDARLPPPLREAAEQAIADRCAAHRLVRLRATIIDALVHPTDATARRFAEAGARAVDAYVGRRPPV